jgi:hypothetical protein
VGEQRVGPGIDPKQPIWSPGGRNTDDVEALPPEPRVSIMRGGESDGVAQTEHNHFGNCPVCGVDMRDLGQVLARIQDTEPEIIEGS